MPAMSSLHSLLALILLTVSLVSAFPADGAVNGTLPPSVHHLMKRGNSKNHNSGKAAEAKKVGQLPWDKLECECKVSEQHIPVIGNMGWHFDLRIRGFGDDGDKGKEYCGKGVLDNLHGECHTKIDIRQWFCEKTGNWGRHISWDSSKTFHHSGVEMALWRSSYEQMGGCKCDYNYGSSLAKSVVAGIAMAVPVPVAQVAKVAGTAVAAGVKAAVQVGKSVAKQANNKKGK